MRGLRRLSRPPKLFGRLTIAVVLVMLGLAYGYASRRTETAGRRLASTLLAERFATGRLSGQEAWQACVPVDTAALVPRMRCGAPLDPRSWRARRINALSRLTRQAPQPDSSPAALRGSALLDLRFADTATVALERAVSALEHALRLVPGDAGIQNDLAVAQLAIGERTQQLTPMLRALDAIDRAAEADSLRPEILFNRALIRQRLYMIATAEQAWARYLAVERDPRWRAEAQAHSRWVAQVPDTVSWDSMLTEPPARMDASARAQIAKRVALSPQKAREFGFPLLGAWGTAVQAGDSARARRLLAVAREIGAAARALGVDESVWLALEAIDAAARDPGRTRDLAQGHVLMGKGLDLYNLGEYDAAVSTLARSHDRLHQGGSPAAGWAAFYQAASEVNRVGYARGDSILHTVVTEAGTNEPALTGKALWALGLSQLRRGHHDEATRLYKQALPHIERAGDRENEGALALLLSEGHTFAGLSNAGAAQAHRALRLLSPFRKSTYLNNHLTATSRYANNQGLGHAALAITGELVEVAEGIGRPRLLALALSARMRNHDAVGRWDAAQSDLEEARRWADSIADGRGGSRLRAHVLLAIGQVTRRHDSRAALPLLADAVSIYSSFHSDVNLPTALYEAALAARATGDPRAQGWLEQAVAHVEHQRGTFHSTEARATFYETVENIFDEMISIELDARRPDRAFQMLERGRVHAAPAEGGIGPVNEAPHPARIARSLPVDMLLVEYGVLHDRLVIWAISRQGSWHHSVPLPRDSLAALVAGFGSGALDQSGAERLYDLLLRPLTEQFGGVHQLTVVPDRELNLVPYAALRDRTTGQFVIERFRVRTVPSASFFTTASGAPQTIEAGSRALVIGNPTLEPDVAAHLPPLPGSAREAADVAALYPGATLLRGRDARRGSVLQLLPEHSVIHFAGHAVFNASRPELSYLALAPDAPGEGGALRAWEIGGLRLSNVQVVVLSACSSLSPRASRTGAVAGLAYSFLRAGAPATVSTLWDVEDGATTELLVRLHRHLAAGTPAAEALRLAQVEALRSSRPELRAARTWAAFIYTGP
jgi:CHAT domain-containing protein